MKEEGENAVGNAKERREREEGGMRTPTTEKTESCQRKLFCKSSVWVNLLERFGIADQSNFAQCPYFQRRNPTVLSKKSAEADRSAL